MAPNTPRMNLHSDTGLPQLLSLDETLGAILLGAVFGFMCEYAWITFMGSVAEASPFRLYGLMLHQAYRYYHGYHDDSIGLKTLILMMVAMETFHTVLWIMVCYEYLVTSYFNPLSLAKMHWYIRVTHGSRDGERSAHTKLGALGLLMGNRPPRKAFTGILSGIFYAGRLYYLGPQYRPMVVIAVFVLLLSLGELELLQSHHRQPRASRAVYYVDRMGFSFSSETLLDFEHFSWIVSVAYGLAVLCGIITVSALIFALRRSRTGTKRTNSVVDMIVLYLINTGLLTTPVKTSTL
ncbi:hypothetical protein ONZ51_g1678 [Trametes cubensis]|uniref:Uncharacterized protein n=1 Tax=Trametes cubensis TaxID=1111947 RepID=A0AAD7U0Z2_9APHY|nr:hypothetical protein ONZ51_g1678 [Trametes cubensis]